MKNVPGVELLDITTSSGSSSQLTGSDSPSSAISQPSNQSFIKSTSENTSSEESTSATNSPVKSARNKSSGDKMTKAKTRELEKATRFIERLGLTEQDLAKVNLTLEELAPFFNTKNRFIKKLTKPLHRIYWDNFITKLLTLMVYDRNRLKSLQTEVAFGYGPDVDKKSESTIANDKHISGVLPLPTWPKSRGLLLDSAVRLSLVFAATDFYKGTVLVAEKLFPLIFYSFTINEIVNYFNNRSQAAINSFEAFKVILGQSDRTQSVAALIGTPYIALPIFLAPFAFGALKGAFSLSQGKALSDKKIQAAIEALNQYPVEYPAEFSKKLAWFLTDTIRWLIPFHPLGRAQRRIERATAFDGRLTQAQRLAMLEAILAYAEKAHLLSLAKVMYVFADIGNAISLQDFKHLENAGYDKSIIAAALASKVKAKSFLRMLGDNYQLPDSAVPTTTKERAISYLWPLPRFVYANYLLWYFGEASKLYLQPFFWGYEIFRAYGIVSLLITLVRGIVALIEQAATKAQCLADGKIWSYIPEISAENCTVCYSAQWNVPYKESWTDKSCVEWFMKTPRTADELLIAIDYFDFSQVNNITLSYHRLNDTGTSLVLDALRGKVVTLGYFRPPKPNNQTSFAFGRFFKNVAISFLDFNKIGIVESDAVAVAYGFSQAKNISQIDISWNNLNSGGGIIVSGALPETITMLNTGYINLGDSGASFLAEKIKQLKYLTSLSVTGNNIYNNGYITLINALPDTSIEYYDTSYNYNTWPGVAGVNAIADILNRTNIQELDISSTGLSSSNCLPLFQALPSTNVWHLRIRFSANLGDEGIALLAGYLANSKITQLDLYKVGMTTNGMRSLAQAFKNSEITDLIISNNGLGDDAALVLADNMPPKLKNLVATRNNFGTVGIQAIFKNAPPTFTQADFRYNQLTNDSLSYIPPTLKFLRLGYNPNIGDGGARIIAQQLNQTEIYYLDLENVGITDIGGIAITDAVSTANVTDLNLSNNALTDVTINEMATKLKNVQYLYVAKNRNITSSSVINFASNMTQFIPSTRTFVWTQAIAMAEEDRRALTLAQPNNEFRRIDFSGNLGIGNDGASIFYNVLPSTHVSCADAIFTGTSVNQSLIDSCGFIESITSSASALQAPWPYATLADSIIYSRDVLNNIYRHSRGTAAEPNAAMIFQLAGYLFIVSVLLTLARAMYSRYGKEAYATNDSQVQFVELESELHSDSTVQIEQADDEGTINSNNSQFGKKSSVTICGSTFFARRSASTVELPRLESGVEFTQRDFTVEYTC